MGSELGNFDSPSQLPAQLLSRMIMFKISKRFEAHWKEECDASYDETHFIPFPICVIILIHGTFGAAAENNTDTF